MDWADFENLAAEIKAKEVDVLTEKAWLCNKAIEHNAKGDLAALWGCSKQYIQGWGDVWLMLGPGTIYPDVPLSLYRAALETNDPRTWLHRAIDNEWSARQLRDAADISKGRRVSRVKWLPDVECIVSHLEAEGRDNEINSISLVLKLLDYVPSGKMPERVRVTAVEVLEK